MALGPPRDTAGAVNTNRRAAGLFCCPPADARSGFFSERWSTSGRSNIRTCSRAAEHLLDFPESAERAGVVVRFSPLRFSYSPFLPSFNLQERGQEPRIHSCVVPRVKLYRAYLCADIAQCAWTRLGGFLSPASNSVSLFLRPG